LGTQPGGTAPRESAFWQKHDVERTYRAWGNEHGKLIRIVKAIRKAKAETLFGIGVKLSVSELFEDEDAVKANENARRSLAALTGVDFIAATGSLTEEV
jgi:valyl-tRNA synthetase